MYRQDLNRGISHKFTLNNGRFEMKGGTEKVTDNLYFTLQFVGFFRIYYPDFVLNLSWLLQKTSSRIGAFKTLVLGNVKKSLDKYFPTVKIDGINTIYKYNDRKGFGIAITYSFRLEQETQYTAVTFIQV
jgi:hypothetical protein